MKENTVRFWKISHMAISKIGREYGTTAAAKVLLYTLFSQRQADPSRKAARIDHVSRNVSE